MTHRGPFQPLPFCDSVIPRPASWRRRLPRSPQPSTKPGSSHPPLAPQPNADIDGVSSGHGGGCEMSPATARQDNRAASPSRGPLGTHMLPARREGPGGVKRGHERPRTWGESPSKPAVPHSGAVDSAEKGRWGWTPWQLPASSPEGRARSEGRVGEGEGTGSEEAAVGKREGGREPRSISANRSRPGARASKADGTGKLPSQRERGRSALKGVRSPPPRPAAMLSWRIILARARGPALCYRSGRGGGEARRSMG